MNLSTLILKAENDLKTISEEVKTLTKENRISKRENEKAWKLKQRFLEIRKELEHSKRQKEILSAESKVINEEPEVYNHLRDIVYQGWDSSTKYNYYNASTDIHFGPYRVNLSRTNSPNTHTVRQFKLYGPKSHLKGETTTHCYSTGVVTINGISLTEGYSGCYQEDMVKALCFLYVKYGKKSWLKNM